jgi:hypothetical protein
MAFVDSIIYDSGGYTGNTYYVRFVDADTGAIWDGVAGAMVAAASAVWANCAIALADQAALGQYPITVPTNLPTGQRYDIVVHLQAGSVPINTDDIAEQYQIMRGSIFGF